MVPAEHAASQKADPLAAEATLDSVAAWAGVSRQTVSNALHHPQRLAPATREKVMQAVAELGYRPSLPARQLVTRRANAIAVRADTMQDGITGLVLDEFFHGLAEAGHARGLRVVLYPQQPDERAELDLVEGLLHSRAADALVLTATNPADHRPNRLARAGYLFCAFGRPWGLEVAPHDWVDVDGAQGTGLAVAYLLESEHRRIAYLGWPDDHGTGSDRRRGWAKALDDASVPGPRIEATCANDAAEAQAVTTALLAGAAVPDSIVCVSDTVALGAYRAVQAAAAVGRAPVTVVGFDATPVASALGFPSVAQPIGEVAHTCVDLLFRRMSGESPDATGVLLSPTLAVPS